MKVSAMMAGCFYNVGEIVGLQPTDAAMYVDLAIVERVTLADRDAHLEKARADEAARTHPSSLVHLRCHISTVVDGAYYSSVRQEIASFGPDKAKELLGWRTAAGHSFFEEVPLDEMELLWLQQRQDRERQAAARPTLTLVEFLISFAVLGAYYNKGETAAFSGEPLRYLLEARTATGEPFVKRLHDVHADDGSPVVAKAAVEP